MGRSRTVGRGDKVGAVVTEGPVGLRGGKRGIRSAGARGPREHPARQDAAPVGQLAPPPAQVLAERERVGERLVHQRHLGNVPTANVVIESGMGKRYIVIVGHRARASNVKRKTG